MPPASPASSAAPASTAWRRSTSPSRAPAPPFRPAARWPPRAASRAGWRPAAATSSALLPAPAGPWRATGRLTAAADLIAADDLAFDLGGQPARGAATLRLAPDARLDIALVAGRLDLDAWVGGAAAVARVRAAQRGAGQHRPVGRIDRLRRPAAAPAARRLLPGRRAAVAVRRLGPAAGRHRPSRSPAPPPGRAWSSPCISPAKTLRETLAALGLPLAGTDPARLRSAEGRFKLALEGTETAISDLAATLDGARWPATGSGGRGGDGAPRAPFGLGLTIDRLDLNGLLPPLPDAAALNARLGRLRPQPPPRRRQGWPGAS